MGKSMKTAAIVQARMGSTRFPNKVMKLIEGIPMVEILLKRLKEAKEIDEIILATSSDAKNIPLVEHVQKLGFQVYQGSEEDVLGRYYHAASLCSADLVVRITGDCPLVDPELVDQMVRECKKERVDYFSNVFPPTYPDGLDI